MKLKTCFLVSAAINVLLLGTLIVSRSDRSADSTPAAMDVSRPTEPPASRSATSQPATPSPASLPEARSGLKHWIDQLRASGAPATLLADVACADFERRREERRRELQRQEELGDIDIERLTEFELRRDADREEELRKVLSAAEFKRWDSDNLLREFELSRLSVSTAETDALYEARKEWRQQQRDLEQARRHGEIDDTDFERKQLDLWAQSDDRFKAILGEERYAALNNVNDEGAAQLRRSLKQLNANGTQFETLLQTQRDWNQRRAELDRQHAAGSLDPKAYEQQVGQLDAERDQQYRKTLGDENFARMQKEQDESYRTLKHYASAWQLNDADVDYVFRTLRYHQASVNQYRQQAQNLEQEGQAVDWPSVKRNIQEFTGQTEEMLMKYLGKERFERMSRNELMLALREK